MKLPIHEGPFKPSLESLKQYRYPKWFRDAKLGIWAHWGPQAVPMEGDWYARNMYIQGSAQYEHHLQTYGHPSEHGYREIINLWKAEKWDPERLMALYKEAGAKYFVSMGVHHDNFDLWNSKFHKWNAVKMGPKKDVVGTWEAAARKLGLRFGVSEHLGASFTWFQPSHGSDKTGPEAGVDYDGTDPHYDDLYHKKAEPGDTGWYSNNPEWHAEWFQRIKDLVDNYHPDLLYTDGGIPFGEVGAAQVANLYNQQPDAVYTCKQTSGGRWVQDLERGVLGGINPEPWQTDTSIGDWFYNKHWKFRGADWVIHMLVDIVSKNGNLLINVVQRPDGSLDPDAEQILADMAEWMKVNGESIYGTRPWLVFGEGPVKAQGGMFREDFGYGAEDVRFVTKGNGTLYATFLGWPQGKNVLIRSLAAAPGANGKIEDVSWLGSNEKVRWSQTAKGLRVDAPLSQPSKFAIVLKITGTRLRSFKPVSTSKPLAVVQEREGAYTFMPDDAQLTGQVQVETKDGQPNLGYWDNPADKATWTVDVKAENAFFVVASCAAAAGPTEFAIDFPGKTIFGHVAQTDGWDKFKDVILERVVLKKGKQKVTIRAKDPATWKAMNLRWIKLTSAGR